MSIILQNVSSVFDLTAPQKSINHFFNNNNISYPNTVHVSLPGEK